MNTEFRFTAFDWYEAKNDVPDNEGLIERLKDRGIFNYKIIVDGSVENYEKVSEESDQDTFMVTYKVTVDISTMGEKLS